MCDEIINKISKTWRECIKNIWEVAPLECPNCGGEMKIISFITEVKDKVSLSQLFITKTYLALTLLLATFHCKSSLLSIAQNC
jgi:hypothetical protein